MWWGWKLRLPEGFSVDSPRSLKISVCFPKSRESSKFGDNVGIWGRIMWITRKSLEVKWTKPGQLTALGVTDSWGRSRWSPAGVDLRADPAQRVLFKNTCYKSYFFFFFFKDPSEEPIGVQINSTLWHPGVKGSVLRPGGWRAVEGGGITLISQRLNADAGDGSWLSARTLGEKRRLSPPREPGAGAATATSPRGGSWAGGVASASWGRPVPAPAQPPVQQRTRDRPGRRAGPRATGTTATQTRPLRNPQPPAQPPLHRRSRRTGAGPAEAEAQERSHQPSGRAHRTPLVETQRLAYWFCLCMETGLPSALALRILGRPDFRVWSSLIRWRRYHSWMSTGPSQRRSQSSAFASIPKNSREAKNPLQPTAFPFPPRGFRNPPHHHVVPARVSGTWTARDGDLEVPLLCSISFWKFLAVPRTGRRPHPARGSAPG